MLNASVTDKYSRLDYIFVSPQLSEEEISCEIISIGNTDLRGVILVFRNIAPTRGPVLWRFKNSYLKDSAFINKMNAFLEEVIDNANDEDIFGQW